MSGRSPTSNALSVRICFCADVEGSIRDDRRDFERSPTANQRDPPCRCLFDAYMVGSNLSGSWNGIIGRTHPEPRGPSISQRSTSCVSPVAHLTSPGSRVHTRSRPPGRVLLLPKDPPIRKHRPGPSVLIFLTIQVPDYLTTVRRRSSLIPTKSALFKTASTIPISAPVSLKRDYERPARRLQLRRMAISRERAGSDVG